MQSLGSEKARRLRPVLVPSAFEPRRYAIYTNARREKRGADQFQRKHLGDFLSLYESVRRWAERRVRVQLPLLPGYLFVYIPLQGRLQVLEIPSIVRVVSFGGEPVPLPESDIEFLRHGLAGLRAELHPYLTVGKRVRMKSGSFQGIKGILKREWDNFRLVLSIDLIVSSVIIDIDGAAVDPVK